MANTPFWPWCPVPGASRSTKLMVDQTNYGDGYAHRSTRGLNPVRPSWQLVFPFVGLDALDAMDSFLAANACAGFWIRPPDATADMFVTVDAWAASISDRNLNNGIVGTLQATFTRAFNPQPIDTATPTLEASVTKSLAYLKSQAAARTAYTSSTLKPADTSQDRHSVGTWTGTWTLPVNANPSVPYSPILITGPLWFPVSAGTRVDFAGTVDAPFASMDGWQGRRDMANPAPPPDYITDPATVYADGGTNWGRYFVMGSVGGAAQFIAPVGANRSWQATVANAPFGQWTFQVITYANQADADADANRILVGAPWRESERPGDVRSYYSAGYTEGTPQFAGVVVTPSSGGSDNTIAGSLQAFTSTPGRTYQILATDEADVEYAYALAPVSEAGAFLISRPSYETFGGAIKLRLVEQVNGCTVRVVGQVWAEENAAAGATAYPDLRIEYRGITDLVPPFPASVQAAQRDGTWALALAGGGAVGRASLVNVNTKRVLGEYTMPTGLLRSFIVPPYDAGQDTTSVYYDGFADTCFLYDQAVALCAFLQAGEQEAAAKLVDALLTVQNPDSSFPFATGQATLTEHNSAFIRIGAVAWVCYALLLAAQPAYAGWFATSPGPAAKACLDYILTFTNSIGTVDGGKGQYVDGVLDPAFTIPWWSTEHNIDTWWCCDLAHQLFGDDAYAVARDGIRVAMQAVGKGWDSTNGIFWQGGVASGGGNTPDGMHALDTHTWGAVLLEKWLATTDARTSIDRANRLYYVQDAASGLWGYTTFIPQDGYPPETIKTPWYEGSFGAVLAIRGLDAAQADSVMAQLIKAQRSDGSYLYALAADPVNDIHPWPALIASAWNVCCYFGPGTPYTRVVWPLP